MRAKIHDRCEEQDDTRLVEYTFRYGGGEGTMRVEADAKAKMPSDDSTEHWFKEHQWGYGITRGGRTLRYEVQHPSWACYLIRSSVIDVDWGRIYGSEWAYMRDAQPLSVVLAAGSEIKVFGAQSN